MLGTGRAWLSNPTAASGPGKTTSVGERSEPSLLSLLGEVAARSDAGEGAALECSSLTRRATMDVIEAVSASVSPRRERLWGSLRAPENSIALGMKQR